MFGVAPAGNMTSSALVGGHVCGGYKDGEHAGT
jgi:hypothetical protein